MATPLEYMHAAMRRAQYERVENEGWFATIPELPGLWASGPTIEDARKDLFHALDGWISVHVIAGQNRLPDIDGVSVYDVPKVEAE
jgi:predicted RNase H-like HicB family nuclease